MKVTDKTITKEAIRKMQLSEYYMLKEFKSFCEKHELVYTLAYGTLIGVVRHRGFVPWDDDIDIAMLRDEYNRFLELSKDWNHPDIFVQNYHTDKEFIHSFTRLRLNGTLAVQEDWQCLDVHHGIFVDIFPFDVTAGTKKECQEHADLIRNIQNQKMKIVMSRTSNAHNLYDLNVKQTRLITKYNSKLTRNSRVAHMTQGLEKYYDYRRNVKDFYDYENMQFEDDVFPVPKNYDSLLKQVYGDYLKEPDEEEKYPHHGIIKIKFREDILSKLSKK